MYIGSSLSIDGQVIIFYWIAGFHPAIHKNKISKILNFIQN
jgi:hypothetical protein